MDEYQTMVQRELILLRARKDAEELFQKEELEKERKSREEKARERATQIIDSFIKLFQVNHTTGGKGVWILMNEFLKKYGVEEYSISFSEFAERSGIQIHE
jgi:hypothetical protein